MSISFSLRDCCKHELRVLIVFFLCNFFLLVTFMLTDDSGFVDRNDYTDCL